VGCVITRNDGSILLVKEKSGPASVKGGIWKLPTGLVDPKEDLQDAAIREAKEETCLDCRFDSIVCFRHSHGGSPSLGATSDLFFVCLLKLIDEHQQTCLQESEILESCWTHFSRIHETTGCTPGTAAYELMNRVVDIVNKSSDQVISCTKLPAWRRNNCEQWIFFPENTT
jgi:ADP-ribose pyrophosphatase YjhB (NUDIX family)